MPNIRRYANSQFGTIVGNIDDVQTTLVINASAGYPSSGDFTIKIDDEIILVTAVSGTTWTISRAQEGTTGALHLDGAFVDIVVTAEALSKLGVQSHAGTVIGSRRVLNFVDGGGVTWTITDNSSDDRCDVSAVSTGGAGGSVWRHGTGAPSNGLGNDGDLYLNDSTGDIYYKDTGAYSIIINIQGAAGTNGTTGSFIRSGAGVPSNGLGIDGDLYINTTNSHIYQRSSGTYTDILTLGSGGTGTTIRSGSGAPSSGLGTDGDFYINVTNGDLYLKASGSYSIAGNLKGATGSAGTNGTNGTVIRTGTGIPNNATGVDGDFYFESALGDLYKRISGAYNLIVNLKPVWRNGSGAPSNSLGNNGDYYLDISTADVYYKSTGTYSLLVNIHGTDGANGTVWYNGSGVPSSGLGANGDFYLRTSTNDVYNKVTGSWSLITTLTGGVAGTAVWRDGTGVPSNLLGNDGDYYLDDASGNVYKRASSAYTLVANIQGVSGSIWRNGTTTPSNGVGIDGDYFLDTVSGKVYQRISGAYVAQGCIKVFWRNGNGAPNNATGNDGDYYIDNLTGIYYLRASGVYGSQGTLKIVWRNGTGIPSNGLGLDGDYYINNTNGDLYFRAAGSYGLLFNLTGGTGISGTDGSIWRDGPGVPSNSLGVNGDYYLNLNPGVGDGDVYHKITGAYVKVGNIKGDDGLAGSVWRNGVGLPNNSSGVDGDYYLQVAAINNPFGNGDVYKRIAGIYVKQGNLRSNWFAVNGAPTLSLGIDGDFALNYVNGELYNKISQNWIPIVKLRTDWFHGAGSPGITGQTGDYYINTTNGDVYYNTSGSWGSPIFNMFPGVWTSGTTDPSPGGKDNDSYLNTTDGSIWFHQSGSWVKKVTTRGTHWTFGSGAPSPGGITGDLYIDTVTSNVYVNSAGSWSLSFNIAGTSNAANYIHFNAAVSDSSVPNNSLYCGSDHGSVLCYKNISGVVKTVNVT